MTLLAEEPFAIPAPEAVMERARGENFPVATRILGARLRQRLLAVYGFARLADELGDSAPGERLAGLDWLERELEAALAGRAQHPLLVRLQGVIGECALAREPFVRLIEANRMDQRRTRYETWEQLRDYCRLSADPVGEIVLGVLGAATPQRIALSDSICTALQLAEHCQDVAEDFRLGRVYLPREDLERFGAGEGEIAAAHAAAPLRATIEFEVARARSLLTEGSPLIAQLRGRARIAVAAFAAGGAAALEAIERVGYDVLAGPPRASRGRRARLLVGTLVRGGRPA